MIKIEYYNEEKYLDAIDEYFPETHANVKFDTDDCTLTDIMQGMIDIARFAGYHIDDDVLERVFDDLRENR